MAWVLGILLLINVLNIASAAYFFSVPGDAFVEHTAATYEVVHDEDLSVE